MTDAADAADPTLEPGTYTKQKDGSFIRSPVTEPRDADQAAMDLKTAKVTAAAVEASGFPVPPSVQAVIDAAAAPKSTSSPATPPASAAAPKDA